MPMVNGRFHSLYGRYSSYVSLQIQRYHMAEVRQQAESNASGLSGALSAASRNLSQGLASLAVQAAVKRAQAASSAAQKSSGVNLVT